MAGHNEVIKQHNIHNRERLYELVRQANVGSAWFGNARGMIVREDHSGGMMRKRSFDELARVNCCFSQCAL
jgi:hypothetical protein